MFGLSKQGQVVLFSSTAIALYGYDQGMMSLINTNEDYLKTMGIEEESPLVGVIVSVYYLGTAVGAVLGSQAADYVGRRPSIFTCLAFSALGNLIMFISGLGGWQGTPAMAVMFLGRIIMGLGVGGLDSVVPVYSSELSEDDQRGKALAQEFQANILGLNIAFAVNLIATHSLGKANEWAWRIPIIAMQVFPLALMILIRVLPESPRFFIYHDKEEDAQKALTVIYGEEDSQKQLDQLKESHDKEPDANVSYADMLSPSHDQFHPTVLTIMAQVNQALTGYGAISVYGPQIFQLLGFETTTSELITQGNYVSYFLLMTFSWLLIDAVGRRYIMCWNSLGLVLGFSLLTLFGGLAQESDNLHIPTMPVGIFGVVVLYVTTGCFGIGWLAPVFLIPTEIYPTTARARGTAISVVVWGIANFVVTLLTPLLFNNLGFWLFLVFAITNTFAGVYTFLYQPESGGRSFEENQEFFKAAKEEGSWRVGKVSKGEFQRFPIEDENGERQPLLSRVQEQATG